MREKFKTKQNEYREVSMPVTPKRKTSRKFKLQKSVKSSISNEVTKRRHAEFQKQSNLSLSLQAG